MFKSPKKSGNIDTTLLNVLRQHILIVYNAAEQVTLYKHINELCQERKAFLAVDKVGDCFRRIFLNCPNSFEDGLTHRQAGSAKAKFAELLFQHGRSYLNNKDEVKCLIIAENDNNVRGTDLGNVINDRIDFLRGEGNYKTPSLEPKPFGGRLT